MHLYLVNCMFVQGSTIALSGPAPCLKITSAHAHEGQSHKFVNGEHFCVYFVSIVKPLIEYTKTSKLVHQKDCCN